MNVMYTDGRIKRLVCNDIDGQAYHGQDDSATISIISTDHAEFEAAEYAEISVEDAGYTIIKMHSRQVGISSV